MIPKKLYEASKGAVKELLKLASMMNTAMKSSIDLNEDAVEEASSMMDINVSSKLHNVKAAR